MRWFHAAVYLVVLPLAYTGWRLLGGAEGRPSVLARLAGTSDARLHVWLGRVLALLILLPLVAGRRGVATFVRETFRRDAGDGRWWLRWPGAVFTGRFARHEGDFDPGQRVANVVIVLGLLALTITGIGLTLLHGGPVFAWLARIHRWTFYVVTLALVGHIVVAAGLLPGYRGAWRSMHLGGRVRLATSRRLWPAWTERTVDTASVADDGDGLDLDELTGVAQERHAQERRRRRRDG